MAKLEADYLKKIEIWYLKELGLLKGGFSGMVTIAWGQPDSDNRATIGIGALVDTDDWEDHVQFKYAQVNEGGEREEFDYRVKLDRTWCTFGGHRYWFLCPHCNRRVGVLYKGGDYFACRHCYSLTYASRNLSGVEKSFGRFLSIPEVRDLENAAKRKYYRGRATRKYARFLREFVRMQTAFRGNIMALAERCNIS